MSWTTKRNGGLDVNGEWKWASSWSGERPLKNYPATTYEIFIEGMSVGRGVQPYEWSGDLVFQGLRFPVTSSHPSCNSVVDATRHADDALTRTTIERALRKFYDKETARCLYKRDGTGRDVPLLTLFGKFDIRKAIERGEMEFGTYYVVLSSRSGLKRITRETLEPHTTFYHECPNRGLESWIYEEVS